MNLEGGGFCLKRSITHSMYSNVGNREVNEDAIGCKTSGDTYAFFLCDGLGGHGMGEIASSLAISAFESQFRNTKNASEFFCDAFQAAQDVIIAEQRERSAVNKMKTTAVIVQISNNKVNIGHIGDSRAYVFHRNRIKMRTLDHSIPQMLVLSGDINENEIRNHPSRSILLRVIGVEWNEPLYEISKPVPIRRADAILLCSDGFWELIDETTMCELLKESTSASEWLEKMKQVVFANGKDLNMDNNSAIAVWIR